MEYKNCWINNIELREGDNNEMNLYNEYLNLLIKNEIPNFLQKYLTV